MRVALVTAGKLRDKFFERFEALSRHVDSITIFSGSDIAIDRPNVECTEVLERAGLLTFVVFPFLFIPRVLYHQVFGDPYDIAHSLDYFVGPGCVTLLSLVTSATSVVSIRGLPIQVTPEYRRTAAENREYHCLLLSKALERYYQTLVPFVDVLVFKSASEQAYFASLAPTAIDHKCYIIPTGVDIDHFVPSAGADAHNALESETWDAVADTYTILFAGRLVPAKGIKSLVKMHAALDCEDVSLVVVGDSQGILDDDDYVREVREIAADCDSIYLHDRVPYEAMPALLRRSDAVALLTPSQHEGAPKIVQEALAMGNPCITSNISGITQPFADVSGCLLIDPENKAAYHRAVERLINEGVRIDLDLVYERFDLEANYERVAAIYAAHTAD